MPSLLPILIVDKGDAQNLTSWGQYHKYAQIVAILLALNRTFPDIVDVFSIGKSFLGREIYCVRLTNENDTSAKPEVFFDGYHHAREQITSELTLFFVVYVATNYGSDITIADLLDNCDVYVVVALNVDGFDLFERNNRQRVNARGVDLNRNYDYAWTGAGEAPFSEPETVAIRDFTLAHHFKYALSFHSGRVGALPVVVHTPTASRFSQAGRNLEGHFRRDSGHTIRAVLLSLHRKWNVGRLDVWSGRCSCDHV